MHFKSYTEAGLRQSSSDTFEIAPWRLIIVHFVSNFSTRLETVVIHHFGSLSNFILYNLHIEFDVYSLIQHQIENFQRIYCRSSFCAQKSSMRNIDWKFNATVTEVVLYGTSVYAQHNVIYFLFYSRNV